MKLRQQAGKAAKTGGGNPGERSLNMGKVGGSSPSLRINFPWYKRWRITWMWGQRLGRPECPYLIRWVFSTPFGSIRLHHWLASDDDRYHHDHSWWFITLVLRGGYTDVFTTGQVRCEAGCVAFRPAMHRHTVRVDKGGCWTLLLTGPEKRFWGFWVKNKFKKSNKYFLEHGHHPCAL